MSSSIGMFRTLSILAFVAAAVLPAKAQTGGVEPRPRAVVELYTSQGCSSCPPADKLMAELVKDSSLIILSLPVDYWDYLGWRDTLAHSAFTYRQRAYSAIRGDRKVYTPQAVINGVAHAVGSDRAQIEKAAADTRGQGGVMAAEIAITRGEGGLAVRCPSREAEADPGHLWAMPFVRERSVQIGRGENGGRSVSYVNVVRGLSRIGECRGPAGAVSIPAASLTDDADGVVVLLQSGNEKKPGPVLAAARFWLR
jgi:hypothetical protein